MLQSHTNEGERHCRLPPVPEIPVYRTQFFFTDGIPRLLLRLVRVLVPGTLSPESTVLNNDWSPWYLDDLPSLYISIASDLRRAAENLDPQILHCLDAGSVLADDQRNRFERVQVSWQAFRTSLLQRWRASNILTGILLVILMFLLGLSEVDQHTLTRTTAQIATCCTTMSLVYATTLSLYFGSIRSVGQAHAVILETTKPITRPSFNLWVLLSMPALCAVWAMTFFIVSVLSLIWQHYYGGKLVDHRILLVDTFAPQILATAVFALGIAGLVMIIKALIGYSKSSRLPTDLHHDISSPTPPKDI